MNPKLQALIARTLLGAMLVEIPILTLELSKPNPDFRLLALGLLGGLAAYLDKQFSPQLADHILPNATMMPDQSGVVMTIPEAEVPPAPAAVLPAPPHG